MGIAAGITVDGFVVCNPYSAQIIGFGCSHHNIARLELRTGLFDDVVIVLSVLGHLRFN